MPRRQALGTLIEGVLQALEKGQMLRVEAQRALGLKSQANFRDRYLKPALDAGLIERGV